MRRHRFSISNSSTQPTVGVLLTKFKLHLAGGSSALPLPPGLTIERVIADYLRELGGLILKYLQNKYGAHYSNKVIQWCVTVPSIWDNSAKASMKSCMVAAGLVNGEHGSPHPQLVVLEPEAASFYCHKVMTEISLRVGNKLLVADIGGGTSDIVVQEVVNVIPGYKVREVTISSGGLCGGTYVDSRFIDFLKTRIGPCFSECIEKHPSVIGQLVHQWQTTKCSFGDHVVASGNTYINLPRRLVEEWESGDRRRGIPARQDYDEFELSYTEIQSIFDPIVQENVHLIQRQLAEAGGAVKVLALVGGFAESPYLISMMRQTFACRVGSIVCPPHRGSAVCQGAVALAFNPSTIVSRICKKTYGFEINLPFEAGVDPVEFRVRCDDGSIWCENGFSVLVKKGDEIMVDEPKSVTCVPIQYGQKSVSIVLFSSEETSPPRYTTGRLVKEGNIILDISRDMTLDKNREIEVSMFYGGSFLEVKADGVNFMAEPVRLPVEIDYLLS